MPSEASLKAAKGKGAVKKLPPWAWIAAAGIGLLIGYVLLKKSGGSNPLSPSSGDTPSSDSSSGEGDNSPGGLTLDDLLKALGLSPGVGPGYGDASGDTSLPPDQSTTEEVDSGKQSLFPAYSGPTNVNSQFPSYSGPTTVSSQAPAYSGPTTINVFGGGFATPTPIGQPPGATFSAPASSPAPASTIPRHFSSE